MQRTTTIILLLWWAAATQARGAVVPGRWEKVAGLEPGTGIRLELVTTDRLELVFRQLTPEAVLVDSDTGVRSFRREDIRRIERLERQYPRRFRLILPAAGFGVGFATALANDNARVHYDLSAASNGLIIGGIGAGIGFAVGAILDRQDDSKNLLYVSTPSSGRP